MSCSDEMNQSRGKTGSDEAEEAAAAMEEEEEEADGVGGGGGSQREGLVGWQRRWRLREFLEAFDDLADGYRFARIVHVTPLNQSARCVDLAGPQEQLEASSSERSRDDGHGSRAGR